MLSAVLAHVVCRAIMQVVAMKRVSKEGSRSSSGSEADDKEQLSPVAVMDFPFDDDDDELRDAAVASYPSFSLARLQSKSSSLSIYRVNKKWSQEEYKKVRSFFFYVLACHLRTRSGPDPRNRLRSCAVAS
jgi:hypothetical protein